MNPALAFAVFSATLFAAHQIADHVLGQTDNQASHKADPGLTGWRHILGHVLAYHLVMAVMVTVTIVALDVPVTATGIAAGLAFSAITHAFIDRRWPVRWLLEHTGSTPFSRLAGHGINGMYLADQALHYACLWISALLLARL
ncbi:DUF3307 domain-containing protein [Polymorphospora sp. NPDC051019]|uniref:DUF3307 domain-containing protein n=1 Tax=Polymorphospora sp. NPDC051019 TaxID=3155725 RepID=UPI00342C4163